MALLKRIDAAGKRFVPVYQNCYNPLVQFVRQLIVEGMEKSDTTFPSRDEVVAGIELMERLSF